MKKTEDEKLGCPHVPGLRSVKRGRIMRSNRHMRSSFLIYMETLFRRQWRKLNALCYPPDDKLRFFFDTMKTHLADLSVNHDDPIKERLGDFVLLHEDLLKLIPEHWQTDLYQALESLVNLASDLHESIPERQNGCHINQPEDIGLLTDLVKRLSYCVKALEEKYYPLTPLMANLRKHYRKTCERVKNKQEEYECKAYRLNECKARCFYESINCEFAIVSKSLRVVPCIVERHRQMNLVDVPHSHSLTTA